MAWLECVNDNYVLCYRIGTKRFRRALKTGGAFYVMNQHPDRFAATVPIVGASRVNPLNVLDEAIWAFHPRDDFPFGTRSVISSILAAVGEPVPDFPPDSDTTTDFHFDSQLLDLHYTEPARGGHFHFETVYVYEPMYDWMFAHGTIVPEPASIALFAIVSALLSCSRWPRKPLLRVRYTLAQIVSASRDQRG